MNQLLKKFAAFACIGLLLALALQLALSLKMQGKNLWGHDTLHAENQKAALVLLGSSRCWAHFDPNFFEDAFGLESVNIGVSGHSEIPLATMRLQNYLSKNNAPKFVIFNFDPFVDADSTNAKNDFTTKNFLSRYAFFPDRRDLSLLDFFKFDAAEKYIPAYALVKYKMAYSVVFPAKRNLYLTYGYENNDKVWDTIANPPSGIMKKYFFKDAATPEIKKALQQLNSLCIKNHIKLICIQTPVYKSVYEADIFSRSSAICESLGISYINLESEAFRNDISCFYNSNHMNRHGVEKMNEVLSSNDSLKLWLSSGLR